MSRLENHVRDWYPSIWSSQKTDDASENNNAVEGTLFGSEEITQYPVDTIAGSNRPRMLNLERQWDDVLQLTAEEEEFQFGNNVDDDDDKFIEELFDLDIDEDEIVLPDPDPIANDSMVKTLWHDSTYATPDKFQFYSTKKCNVYFWQDYACKAIGQGEFGGLRGMAWRSLWHKDLYEIKHHLAPMEDTTLLFSFMDHMVLLPHQQKVGFMGCIHQLLKCVDSLNAKVEVPITMEKARAILLEGSYGMFGNLPHPPVKEVDGHACISLKDLIRQMCGLKVPIVFTEKPKKKGSTTTVRVNKQIHGSAAMSALLKGLKCQTGHRQGVHYEYLIFWLDDFIVSWV